VPFAVDPADVTPLLTSYQPIAEEYDGSRPDRYDLIATQTQLLLFQVQRLYEKAAAGPREEPRLAADEALASSTSKCLAPAFPMPLLAPVIKIVLDMVVNEKNQQSV
jgi:hypothetical protein